MKFLLPHAPLAGPAAEDLAKRDFLAYLIKFSSHTRLQAFLSIADHLTDAEYWPAVEETWTSVEWIAGHEDLWRRFLFESRPRKGAWRMMNPRERKMLRAFAREFTIYRGQWDLDHDLGFSWTTSRAVATKFAKVYHKRFVGAKRDPDWCPGVVCGRALKRDVLAFLNGRSEREIIIRPELVRVTSNRAV